MSERVILLVFLFGAGRILAQATPAETPLKLARVEQVLMETEPYLRAMPAERWMLLSHELEARGLSRAASELRTRIPTRDLVNELLALGQPGAARAVAEQWKKESPDDATFAEAVAYFAEGMPELSLRSLDTLSTNSPIQQSPITKTLHDLARFQLTRGKAASAEENPWSVNYLAALVPGNAGALPETEKAKIPPGATAALVELIRLMPTSAPTWGLLGSMLAGEGMPGPARASFARARALGYTPRWLLDQDRVLAEIEKNRQTQLDANLSGPIGSTSDDTATEGGWKSLGSRPQTLIVIVVGALFALLIAILQVRQWIMNRSDKNERSSS